MDMLCYVNIYDNNRTIHFNAIMQCNCNLQHSDNSSTYFYRFSISCVLLCCYHFTCKSKIAYRNLQEVISNILLSYICYWSFWWIIVYSVYSSFVNMSVKSEKDKQKALHEKNQMILSALLRDDDNKYCVDCDAKGWNFGCLLDT